MVSEALAAEYLGIRVGVLRERQYRRLADVKAQHLEDDAGDYRYLDEAPPFAMRGCSRVYRLPEVAAWEARRRERDRKAYAFTMPEIQLAGLMGMGKQALRKRRYGIELGTYNVDCLPPWLVIGHKNVVVYRHVDVTWWANHGAVKWGRLGKDRLKNLQDAVRKLAL